MEIFFVSATIMGAAMAFIFALLDSTLDLNLASRIYRRVIREFFLGDYKFEKDKKNTCAESESVL